MAKKPIGTIQVMPTTQRLVATQEGSLSTVQTIQLWALQMLQAAGPGFETMILQVSRDTSKGVSIKLLPPQSQTTTSGGSSSTPKGTRTQPQVVTSQRGSAKDTLRIG